MKSTVKEKILFANPWIHDFTAFDLWARPLGLLYLISIVDKYVEDKEIYFVDFLDRFSPELRQYVKFPKPKEDGRGKFPRKIIKKPEFLKKIPRNFSQYGIPEEFAIKKLKKIGKVKVAFITSTMTYWYSGVRKTIELIREINKPEIVVLGGIFATLLRDVAEKELPVDLVIAGKGENVILDLLNKIGFKVKEHPYFENIDSLPYPAFEYQSSMPYLPFLTSLGCPFRCPYCATKILSPRFYQRSVEKMVNELTLYKQKFGIKHIVFYDDALLINKRKRLLPLLEKLNKKGLKFIFHTPNGIHIREIDEKTAKMMFENNFKTIRLSLETAVSEEKEELSPKDALENFEKALYNLKKAGYKSKEIEVYILFGHPLQTYESIEKSIDYLKKFSVQIRLSYFSPIPGTKTFDELEKRGIIKKSDDPIYQNKIVFVYEKSGLSVEEILELKNYVFKINKESLLSGD